MHDPERNGGLVTGADGKVQGRKLAALICFSVGMILLVYGAFLPKEVTIEARIGPAIVGLVFSLLFWGLLTVQNVVQLLVLLKGGTRER